MVVFLYHRPLGYYFDRKCDLNGANVINGGLGDVGNEWDHMGDVY